MRLPNYGILLYAVLYFVATQFYPGGCDADKSSIGFNWLHNYWCDLLGAEAKNGTPNAAYPIAIAAMTILFLSLAVFWYHIPLLFSWQLNLSRIIQFTGIASMILPIFIFTRYHDLLINLAGAFGLVGLIAVYIALYRNKLTLLFWLGMFNFLLFLINNYIYNTLNFIYYLPIVQKFTFLFYLTWIYLLNKKVVVKTGNSSS